MKLRDNCRYEIAALTSMGVRIMPADRQPVGAGNLYEMQATSAESNVLNVAASLGKPALVMTRFVEGSSISRYLQSELRRRGIDYTGPSIAKGGPWGYRHQFNIADSGFGARGPEVENDRAGEVGRTLSVSDFDLERIFKHDGVRILHLSGLIAALSPETGQCCVEMARYASQQGTLISFDLNHRASFWVGRETELHAIFHEIAGLCDILIGNEEDFQLALGLEGPPAGGDELESKMESFQGMIARASAAYPHATAFATTLREVSCANEHQWGALLWAEGQWYVEQPRSIQVLDRIGGGDGFVGGLLYGILQGWTPEKWLQFGWATGALATTLLTDYAAPADEASVWRIYKGNARVQR